VPYSLLRRCSYFNPNDYTNQAKKNLISCLNWLSENVDKQIFSTAPWNLWEKFGACFLALRVNSLICIGYNTIIFSKIFAGADINGCSKEVVLRPLTIIQSAEPYSKQLPKEIPIFSYESYKVKWLEGNFVFLNSTNGEGVDIFCSFSCPNSTERIIYADQRKRMAGSLCWKVASEYLDVFDTLTPKVCANTTVYKGLFSIFPHYNYEASSLPKDSILVTYSTTKAYHQSLAVHPAASSCVNVNYDPKSYIIMILMGGDISSSCAGKICVRRKKQKFTSLDELGEFVEANERSIRKGDEDRIVF